MLAEDYAPRLSLRELCDKGGGRAHLRGSWRLECFPLLVPVLVQIAKEFERLAIVGWDACARQKGFESVNGACKVPTGNAENVLVK